jgi:hypothetical protein
MDPLIRMEHQTTNLGVRSSNLFGRANYVAALEELFPFHVFDCFHGIAPWKQYESAPYREPSANIVRSADECATPVHSLAKFA